MPSFYELCQILQDIKNENESLPRRQIKSKEEIDAIASDFFNKFNAGNPPQATAPAPASKATAPASQAPMMDLDQILANLNQHAAASAPAPSASVPAATVNKSSDASTRPKYDLSNINADLPKMSDILKRRKSKTSTKPSQVSTVISPNDPSSPDFLDNFYKKNTNRVVRPSSSKGQTQTATQNIKDELDASFAQKMSNFNNFLADVSYQQLAKYAAKTLGIGTEFPKGRFEINAVANPKSEHPQVILSPEQIKAVIERVNDIISTRGKREELTPGVSMNKAIELDSKTSKNPGLQGIMRRFNSAILGDDFVDKTFTKDQLVNSLTKKLGMVKSDLESQMLNTAALSNLIRIAHENKFGHFFKVHGDINDPNAVIEIKSPKSLGFELDDIDKASNPIKPKQEFKPLRAVENVSESWISILQLINEI